MVSFPIEKAFLSLPQLWVFGLKMHCSLLFFMDSLLIVLKQVTPGMCKTGGAYLVADFFILSMIRIKKCRPACTGDLHIATCCYTPDYVTLTRDHSALKNGALPDF